MSQATSEKITLDHTAQLSVSTDSGANELGTLQSLALGLNLIAGTIWRHEERLRAAEPPGTRTFFFGHRPGTDRRETLLLPCYFHWFGVSLCNYARLTGFLVALDQGAITREDFATAGGRRRVASACKDYVNGLSEISAVLIWRNKVAAHFAITDPRPDDNLSTLDMSVMHPVSYSDGRYRVGEWTMSRSTSDGPAIASEIPMWSITEIYEGLAPRYWPGFRWPSSDAEKAPSDAAPHDERQE
jgi:hypothetical protein